MHVDGQEVALHQAIHVESDYTDGHRPIVPPPALKALRLTGD